MLKKILGVLLLVLVVLSVVIAMQPADFKITRSITIAAPVANIFSHVNDFHQWEAWSPWAKLDPQAKNSYEGSSAGEGAIFRWAGNNEVGEGSMTLIESKVNDRILIKLDFIKPFKAINSAEFTFKVEGSTTLVTWSMSGSNNFIGKAMGLVIDCDKMVGEQFEKGLAQLKAIAESAK